MTATEPLDLLKERRLNRALRRQESRSRSYLAATWRGKTYRWRPTQAPPMVGIAARRAKNKRSRAARKRNR